MIALSACARTDSGFTTCPQSIAATMRSILKLLPVTVAENNPKGSCPLLLTLVITGSGGIKVTVACAVPFGPVADTRRLCAGTLARDPLSCRCTGGEPVGPGGKCCAGLDDRAAFERLGAVMTDSGVEIAEKRGGEGT